MWKSVEFPKTGSTLVVSEVTPYVFKSNRKKSVLWVDLKFKRCSWHVSNPGFTSFLLEHVRFTTYCIASILYNIVWQLSRQLKGCWRCGFPHKTTSEQTFLGFQHYCVIQIVMYFLILALRHTVGKSTASGTHLSFDLIMNYFTLRYVAFHIHFTRIPMGNIKYIIVLHLNLRTISRLVLLLHWQFLFLILLKNISYFDHSIM